jgi:hypothetical protein
MISLKTLAGLEPGYSATQADAMTTAPCLYAKVIFV